MVNEWREVLRAAELAETWKAARDAAYRLVPLFRSLHLSGVSSCL